MDVVVFDRQYSPFIFNFKAAKIVPAESVYAVFEAKQTMDAGLLTYAKSKIASVRRLKCTSLPIPHAGGEFPAKPSIHILGGMLSLESEWSPPLGDSLIIDDRCSGCTAPPDSVLCDGRICRFPVFFPDALHLAFRKKTRRERRPLPS